MPENRRAPAKLRSIDEVNPREDIRIKIVCTVIDKKEDSVVVDDGTGKTEVFLDTEELEEIDEKKRVRIFGRVLPTPESFELQGEIVQEMDDVDFDLYKKVLEVA